MNNNKTVAGCVRRIRKNILSAGCEGRVHCDYGELMKAFDAIEATHKSELTKKDDERLTVVATYETVIAGKDAEIAKLRTLVGELADALKKIDDACDGDMCKHFVDTEQCSKCKYLDTCQTGVAHSTLKTHESEIAKAREVVK